MSEKEKLEYALYNVETLANEVEDGTFMPIRFRKLSPAEWSVARTKYVKFLRDEALTIKARISAGPRRAVIVLN